LIENIEVLKIILKGSVFTYKLAFVGCGYLRDVTERSEAAVMAETMFNNLSVDSRTPCVSRGENFERVTVQIKMSEVPLWLHVIELYGKPIEPILDSQGTLGYQPIW